VDTPEQRYEDLADRVFTLYTEGRQRAALDLLAQPDPELEPWSAELAHSAACLHGSLGDPAAALQVLRTASQGGAWWDPSILTDDDDLAALQSLPEFQELVALSATRRSADPRPALIQLPPDEYDPVLRAAAAGDHVVRVGGVVVALHGAGQTAARAAADWAGVLELGYALVSVESSQRMSPMYRTWPDPELAREDIARALAQLPEELRGLPLIAAGFSAGGRAALDWALTGQPERAAGVVVLAPALRALPAEAQGSLSPATILIGAEDDLLEVVDDAAAQLTSLGLTIHKLPGLGHEVPAGLTDHLRALLPGIDA
jgi:predicted esterase